MNIKKQRLLVEYLASSPDVFASCVEIVSPEYFAPELQYIVQYLINYFNEYKALPGIEQIEVDTGREIKLHDITEDQIKYCQDSIEKFCKKQATIQAIVGAANTIDKDEVTDDEYSIIKEEVTNALTVGIIKHMGVNFFEDPHERIRKLSERSVPVPTGWKHFDNAIDGGLFRKQLLLFSANSGGGKSIAMKNLGINFVMKGYNILFISLELDEDMVDGRLIQMLTGQTSVQWKVDADETARKIMEIGDKRNIGRYQHVRLPQGTTANQIRSYLKNYQLLYKSVPDMIIVDYLDLMGANARVSADNVFEKDKQTSEQLREIGEDYNAFMASASQQNREAIKATHINQSHIAGGISKINTADLHVSIEFTESMRASGEMTFKFVKARTSGALGKAIHMKYDPVSLRITDHGDPNTNAITFNPRQQQIQEEEEEFDEDAIFKIVKK